MGRVSKQSFRPYYEFVAVKRIKKSSDAYIQPGEDIPKGMFKNFHLNSLYRRRMIGVKGSDWAKAMTAAAGNAHAKPEVAAKPVVAPPPAPQQPRPAAPDIKLPDGISIDRSGPGWISIKLDGEEVDKVRGDDALKQWLSDNGYSN